MTDGVRFIFCLKQYINCPFINSSAASVIGYLLDSLIVCFSNHSVKICIALSHPSSIYAVRIVSHADLPTLSLKIKIIDTGKRVDSSLIYGCTLAQFLQLGLVIINKRLSPRNGLFIAISLIGITSFTRGSISKRFWNTAGFSILDRRSLS